jgi:hypothetical protein
MKLKFTIINFLLFVIVFSGFSQKRGFDAGVLGGIVPSQVDGDTYSGYHKIGLQAGTFVRYNINKQFFFFSEIKYIQKGAKQVSKDNSIYYKSVLNYIEVPFSLQYLYDKKYLIEGGTAFSYLVNWYEDFGYGKDRSKEPAFKSYEWSAFGGVGVFLTQKIFLLGRFSYSILPIRMYSEFIQTIKDRGWNNNDLQITIYYKIN